MACGCRGRKAGTIKTVRKAGRAGAEALERKGRVRAARVVRGSSDQVAKFLARVPAPAKKEDPDRPRRTVIRGAA